MKKASSSKGPVNKNPSLHKPQKEGAKVSGTVSSKTYAVTEKSKPATLGKESGAAKALPSNASKICETPMVKTKDVPTSETTSTLVKDSETGKTLRNIAVKTSQTPLVKNVLPNKTSVKLGAKIDNTFSKVVPNKTACKPTTLVTNGKILPAVPTLSAGDDVTPKSMPKDISVSETKGSDPPTISTCKDESKVADCQASEDVAFSCPKNCETVDYVAVKEVLSASAEREPCEDAASAMESVDTLNLNTQISKPTDTDTEASRSDCLLEKTTAADELEHSSVDAVSTDSGIVTLSVVLEQHPLHSPWTFWRLSQDATRNWNDRLKECYSFSTAEIFWALCHRWENQVKLNNGEGHYVFKEGVKPMWEDPMNLRGGKWILVFDPQRRAELKAIWIEVLMCLIGEAFGDDGDDVRGATLDTRHKGDRICIWTADWQNKNSILNIGYILKERLQQVVSTKFMYEKHGQSGQTMGQGQAIYIV